jgi:hypothetical protein
MHNGIDFALDNKIKLLLIIKVALKGLPINGRLSMRVAKSYRARVCEHQHDQLIRNSIG